MIDEWRQVLNEELFSRYRKNVFFFFMIKKLTANGILIFSRFSLLQDEIIF